MAMFATVDAAGVATGFYDSNIHKAIPADAVALTAAQYNAWVANTNGQKWTGTQLAPHVATIPALPLPHIAAGALHASDRVVVRCYEHGVAVPPAWQAYRAALRAIIRGPATVTVLPTAPAFPAGT